MTPRVRHVVGCMTGTSLDGLDTALVRITGSGLEMRARCRGVVSRPLGALGPTLRAMAEGRPHAPIAYLRAARRLGELHARAAAELCADCGIVPPGLAHGPTQPLGPPPRCAEGSGEEGAEAPPRPAVLDLVVAHGQTICHAPRDEAGALSWQLLDPWPISRRLGTPVCWNLRQADLIAGGRGAPITPLADWVIYRDHAAAVANLGGICNITLLDARPERIRAADVGPCNLLLDGLCERLTGEPFDEGGRRAMSGRVTAALPVIRRAMLKAMDEGAATPAGWGTRTLGREQFSAAWLDALRDRLPAAASPEDVLRGAVEAVARIVAAPVRDAGGSGLVLAGGGVRNEALVRAVREQVGSTTVVRLSEELGVASQAREPMGMAVLGALAGDGQALTLPAVTGATAPGAAGAWTRP